MKAGADHAGRTAVGGSGVVYHFGDCELDLLRQELRRDGRRIHTRAKVFAALRFLLINRERMISREEIMDAVWPDVAVSDATLSSCIRSVRQAIGDSGRTPALVQTVRGQGFRFVGSVHEQLSGSAPVRIGTSLDHPSVAVLPFTNLSRDPELDYLSESLAEDITTRLSRFRSLSVIARSSSFGIRHEADDVVLIGEQLGVEYVLDGSIRRLEGVLRATAQLIHAPTARHLWAENYDGSARQLLALHDDISHRVVNDIAPEVVLDQLRQADRQSVGEVEAVKLAWRARATLERARTSADTELFDQGLQLADQAAELDPTCRHAWWTISVGSFVRAFALGGSDAARLLRRSREAALQLRRLDRHDHRAAMALGWISFLERDFPQSQMELDRAHELNPNCTMTLTMQGLLANLHGDSKTAYRKIDRAVSLSPRDIWLGFMLAAKAYACFALARYDEGVALAQRAIAAEPNAPANHTILAACLTALGRLDEAADAIRKQKRINSGFLNLTLDGQRRPFGHSDTAERYLLHLNEACKAARD